LCPICQKDRADRPIIKPSPFTLASYEPMERVSIDSIGPLPEDTNGNKFIIVIIDCFTRFVELYATKDTSALAAANALLHYYGRFGAPCELLSDQGSQYVNQILKQFHDLIGTDRMLSLPYSHEEDSISERVNQAIMKYLRAIVSEKNIKESWGQSLPLVQRIYNSTFHSSIGCTPAKLLFGETINLDRGLFTTANDKELVGSPNDTEHRPTMKVADWAEKMQRLQTELLQAAQQHQYLLDSKHLHDRDNWKYVTSTDNALTKDVSNSEVLVHSMIEATPSTSHRQSIRRRRKREKPVITEFPIDAYVLVAYFKNQNTLRPDKLLPRWRGPLRVVKYEGSEYTLQNLVTNELESVHITQMKPFIFDPLITDPRQVANRDYQAWDVEAVLGHRGDPNRRLSMEFLIQWKGYTKEEATCQPWKNVRLTDKLIEYLKTSKMKKLAYKERI
jgi:hypothetical protein